MRAVVEAIEGEYRRYKKYGDDAMRQLTDAQLTQAPATGNSIATIVWHISGNLKSRFTDFLTSDGEKAWRDRESEFETRNVTSAEVFEKWEDGWRVLFDAMRALDDSHLQQQVTIRGVPLTALEALTRSVTHASYHVGQILFFGKILRGDDWKYLSIPPGKSQEYLKRPEREKPPK